jgi:hypothetical protein
MIDRISGSEIHPNKYKKEIISPCMTAFTTHMKMNQIKVVTILQTIQKKKSVVKRKWVYVFPQRKSEYISS